MEIKSTLQRRNKEMDKECELQGITEAPTEGRSFEICTAMRDAESFNIMLQEIISTVKAIQPSIGNDDLSIAVRLILTLCSSWIEILIDENKLKLVK